MPKDPEPNFSVAKPGPYRTRLTAREEVDFRNWVKDNRVPYDDSPRADYDMRGFWRALQRGDPAARTQTSAFDGRLHFPDTWKTPYHKTFSAESMYATPDAPRWVGDKLIDKQGRVLADETLADETPAPARKDDGGGLY
jgi:hypothetical protein